MWEHLTFSHIKWGVWSLLKCVCWDYVVGIRIHLLCFWFYRGSSLIFHKHKIFHLFLVCIHHKRKYDDNILSWRVFLSWEVCVWWLVCFLFNIAFLWKQGQWNDSHCTCTSHLFELCILFQLSFIKRYQSPICTNLCWVSDKGCIRAVLQIIWIAVHVQVDWCIPSTLLYSGISFGMY